MIRIFDQMSFRLKATLTVLVVIVAGLFVNSMIMYLNANRIIADEQRHAASSMAHSLAQAIEVALAIHDHSELDRLVRGALTNDHVLFAVIYDANGKITAHAENDQTAWDAFLTGDIQSDIFTLAQSPVALKADESGNRAAGNGNGSVIVALSTEPMVQTQREVATIQALTAVSIAAGSSLAIFIAIGPWSQRVRRIAEATENIAGGDFSQSVESDRHDELGRLCHAFEDMRLAIHHRDRELRQFNDTLQQQISDRTADLQRAVVAAEAANHAKSQFLANMSHEIRTPMTAILGYADLMVDPAQDPVDRLECIQTIRRNSAHLLSIINDILDISKIEAGKLTVERIECSPMEIVADVASLMRGRALEKGLSFTVEYSSPIPLTIRTDPTRLRQILMNLCGNGIKFTEQGGIRIVIRLITLQNPDHPCLRFDVHDTGIGLTEQQQSNLFLPFSQADSSTTRTFGGTGLGLTISKRLARMLGGDITLRSNPGRGSCFTLEVEAGPISGVQLVQPEEAGLALAAKGPALNEAASVSSLKDVRILLAEDGPDNQRLICFHLRKAGAIVEVAENGKLAVEKTLDAIEQEAAFDIILMDMQMPEMDGYSASTRLREMGYQGPIVALTAHAMQGDREKCLRAGCNDYTTKPIDRNTLISVVLRWCKPVLRTADQAN